MGQRKIGKKKAIIGGKERSCLHAGIQPGGSKGDPRSTKEHLKTKTEKVRKKPRVLISLRKKGKTKAGKGSDRLAERSKI